MLELGNLITIGGWGLLALSTVVFIVAFLAYIKSRSYVKKIKNQILDIKKEIEQEKREAYSRIKDDIYKKRKDFEYELKKDRLELERQQDKLAVKFEDLQKREERLEFVKSDLLEKERETSRLNDRLRVTESKLKSIYNDLTNKLERISGMTKEEAKKSLIETIKNDVKLSTQKWIQKVEEEAKNTAKEKAISTVVTAMQRYTADTVNSQSSATIQLPQSSQDKDQKDGMKGRIIGKEGRNIKALEMATGMEFVISESAEAITISGFNPVRREIARRALTKLIADGRINPTRIEEVVAQCEKEIEENIEEYGKETILEFNLQGVHPELVTLLGKLYFRTSYSQNVLSHSKEVGVFARMIAEELGLDGQVALRAGLFHDIGKAVTAEVEGPHAIIGAEIAKRCGESPEVVNAIAAHHEEVVFASIYAPIVVIADTLSAARPGARKETFSAYIKRLEKLEEIGTSIEGVKKAYALQAGREIRILVEEDSIDDERAAMMAREIAAKIEEEMNFPGQIKVNVIREKRSIEYAK